MMTEQHEAFLQENKLTQLTKNNKHTWSTPIDLRDSDYEEYELEKDNFDIAGYKDFIVYKPEGMKGKRAYIKTDAENNYLAWSGPIAVADKSKFLRGDLDKVEEESQPSEETAVQEAVNRLNKEVGKNDATDDIVSKIKKLKELLDEGILTEEEYQKKKDELVSQI